MGCYCIDKQGIVTMKTGDLSDKRAFLSDNSKKIVFFCFVIQEFSLLLHPVTVFSGKMVTIRWLPACFGRKKTRGNNPVNPPGKFAFDENEKRIKTTSCCRNFSPDGV